MRLWKYEEFVRFIGRGSTQSSSEMYHVTDRTTDLLLTHG
ncbi:MAG: hypothetical protein JWN13_5651 [Betaproteobacteria bacterium]|jgi:hypothetical protein|nr:hypothetical protein [Betaproteobacteria bacterium]